MKSNGLTSGPLVLPSQALRDQAPEEERRAEGPHLCDKATHSGHDASAWESKNLDRVAAMQPRRALEPGGLVRHLASTDPKPTIARQGGPRDQAWRQGAFSSRP